MDNKYRTLQLEMILNHIATNSQAVTAKYFGEHVKTTFLFLLCIHSRSLSGFLQNASASLSWCYGNRSLIEMHLGGFS